MRLDFNSGYVVTLNDGEKQGLVAMFTDLYEALSYARRIARRNIGDGRYEVSRVEGDDMTVIYVPQGQSGETGNYPGNNMPGMGSVSLIGDGTIPTGEGTKASPYLIASAAQLDWFRDKVNNGESSIHGALTADITYNASMDVEGYDGKSPNKFTPFAPIASNSTGYEGVFNGHGHTVSGIYVDRDDSPWCGLFGNIASGGVVKDITVKDSYFRTSYAGADNVYIGGIAGKDNGVISDCGVQATIVAASDMSAVDSSYINCGGIAGHISGTVTDCTSLGFIGVSGTATGIYCGGMVGYDSGAITDCTYSGNIGVSGTVKGSIHCGGMAGICDNTITGCTSSGSIDVNGTAAFVRCGGMAGYNTASVTDCTYSGNIGVSGTVKGSIHCGGMAGSNDGTISNCASSGSILAHGTASGAYCGGMAGYCGNDSTITDCAFTGDVLANSMTYGLYCGGMAGYVAATGIVTDCAFRGNVDAGSTVKDSIYCGGIAGYIRGLVMGCTSSGGIDASGKAMYIYSGGVAGCVYGTVMNCIASRGVSVSGTAWQIYRDVIAGHVHDGGTVKDCVAKDGADL